MQTNHPNGNRPKPCDRAKIIRSIAWLFLLLIGGVGCSHLDTPPGFDYSPYPWLYLRDGLPLEQGEPTVEVISVGDVMLGRAVANVQDPLGLSAPWLKQADLTIGNLEGVFDLPVTDNSVLPGDPAYEPYRLLIPPSAIDDLKGAGFDILGLANNHAHDLGAEGLARTISLLGQSGIQPMGVSDPELASPAFTVREIRGVKVAFLAVNTIPLPASQTGQDVPQPISWNRDDGLDSVRAARQQADVLIVSIHWGYEYQTRLDPSQQEIARDLMKAGADLVIGHHPHVVQGTQFFQQMDETDLRRVGFVAYSLGNFVFDQFDDDTRHGLALRVIIDRNGLRGIQALPVLAGKRPRLMLLQEAKTLLERLQPELPTLAFGCTQGSCQPAAAAPQRRSGIFTTGAIDLTGDGISETIGLSENQVSVFEDGKIAWQSPAEWRVLDLVLGDPNDDGRWEMLLALEKADADNIQRSHPFIIGYKGGIYRQVWGGSAVSEPIREVELADIDGDGAQELIVLDEFGVGGQQTVGVWEWNGWGFSLTWRSQPGHYKDLVAAPAPGNKALFFSVKVIP